MLYTAATIQWEIYVIHINLMSGNNKRRRKDIVSVKRINTSVVSKYFKQTEGQNKNILSNI